MTMPPVGAPIGGATRSYLIPISDLSLDSRLAVRKNVDESLENAIRILAIRASLSQCVIRDSLPNFDLGLAPAAPNATDEWLVAGAGVAGTELQYFSGLLPQDTVIGFYGVAVENANPQISRIRFTIGPNSQTSLATFQLESLYSRLEPGGYYSEPVLYTRNQTARVLVMPRTGGFGANSQRLTMYARTIEPLGTWVSTPAI